MLFSHKEYKQDWTGESDFQSELLLKFCPSGHKDIRLLKGHVHFY